MKIIELVKAAKASNKEAFGELADARAAAMVAAALAALRKSIGDSAAPVVLAGFGRFIPREAKPGDGAPAGPRRFSFRLAELKTGDTVAPRREQRAAALDARKAATAARPPRDAAAGASATAAKKAARAEARAGAGAAAKARPARKAT